jgi:hypothetical protein
MLRNWWSEMFRLRVLVFVLALIACVPLSRARGQGDKAPPRLPLSRYFDYYPGDPAAKTYHYTHKTLAESETGVETTIQLCDGFDGRLALNWEPVRPDPTHVSLTKNPGKLTITTQRGSIYQSLGPSAKNLYLIRNPLADGGDFVLTTCIESFHPTMPYQQAGLLVYDDDDNYLKCNMEFGQSSVQFRFTRETNGEPINELDRSKVEQDRAWLRIIKRGKSYERSYSSDGIEFVSAGEGEWGTGAPKWIGLVAKNGATGAEEKDAVFDFFEIRSLTSARTATRLSASFRSAEPSVGVSDGEHSSKAVVYRIKTTDPERRLLVLQRILKRRPLGPGSRLEIDPKDASLVVTARPRGNPGGGRSGASGER